MKGLVIIMDNQKLTTKQKVRKFTGNFATIDKKPQDEPDKKNHHRYNQRRNVHHAWIYNFVHFTTSE